MKRGASISRLFMMTAALTFGSQAADASFHLMQIEQVVGGVCGNARVQAIQLRMRAAGQTLVSGARLIAYDAEGLNPIELITFPTNIDNGGAGTRILIASPELADRFGPAPDFMLTGLIPEAYLEAGRITFESSGGTIYWSLAWGGSLYTGSTVGAVSNDADGDFGPAFDAMLPSAEGNALQFQGTAADLSTTNAADYSITVGDALFTNNDGDAAIMGGCIFTDGFESGDLVSWSDFVP